MKHIGVLKPDTLVGLVNWFGIPCIAIYLVSMFVIPLFIGGFSWEYVEAVWSSWQSLNVGMLAFLSSVVAFNISRYNANKQRERDFVAARAFLPEALSELTEYFRSCAPLLEEAWQKANKKARGSLDNQVPCLSDGYKGIFSRCISFADPEVGNHLAFILMRLQVHRARVTSLPEDFREGGNMVVIPANIISHLYDLAELQALINRTFNFARGFDALDLSILSWDDYQTAYYNLDIMYENFDDLEGFTRRAIERRDFGSNK